MVVALRNLRRSYGSCRLPILQPEVQVSPCVKPGGNEEAPQREWRISAQGLSISPRTFPMVGKGTGLFYPKKENKQTKKEWERHTKIWKTMRLLVFTWRRICYPCGSQSRDLTGLQYNGWLTSKNSQKGSGPIALPPEYEWKLLFGGTLLNCLIWNTLKRKASQKPKLDFEKFMKLVLLTYTNSTANGIRSKSNR